MLKSSSAAFAVCSALGLSLWSFASAAQTEETGAAAPSSDPNPATANEAPAAAESAPTNSETDAPALAAFPALPEPATEPAVAPIGSADAAPPSFASAAPPPEHTPTTPSSTFVMTPSSTSPALERDAPQATNSKRDTRAFRLGLVLGTGVPSLFSIGGMFKVTPYFGAGVNVGLIPKVQLSYYGDATLSYQHYDIYARVFPFGGGFFFGAGAGYATVSGTLKNTVDLSAYAAQVPGLQPSVAYESSASVRTLMLTPLIGYFYTFKSGFSLGLDAGAQIPIAPSQTKFDSGLAATLPPEVIGQYLTETDQAVRDSLEQIGRTTIPTLNLRLGWLF